MGALWHRSVMGKRCIYLAGLFRKGQLGLRQ
jgi:hypothetical protein